MAKDTITICLGSSCFARGNEKNLAVIESFLAERNLQDEVDVILGCSLCQDCCGDGPNVLINTKRYGRVDTQVMNLLLKKMFIEK